jgi:hypothetical protein
VSLALKVRFTLHQGTPWLFHLPQGVYHLCSHYFQSLTYCLLPSGCRHKCTTASKFFVHSFLIMKVLRGVLNMYYFIIHLLLNPSQLAFIPMQMKLIFQGSGNNTCKVLNKYLLNEWMNVSDHQINDFQSVSILFTTWSVKPMSLSSSVKCNPHFFLYCILPYNPFDDHFSKAMLQNV